MASPAKLLVRKPQGLEKSTPQTGISVAPNSSTNGVFGHFWTLYGTESGIAATSPASPALTNSFLGDAGDVAALSYTNSNSGVRHPPDYLEHFLA